MDGGAKNKVEWRLKISRCELN